MIETLVAFFVVLGVVVFVHEYGHYAVGRACGIHAEAFSIGFGREILGWTDKRGTRWKVSLIPLGGYVQFKGDANAASGPDDAALEGLTPDERRRTLPGAPLWARTLTILAGPGANFAFTIVVAFVLALAAGAPSDEPVVGSVRADGPAAEAGFEVGDRILSVDGEPVESLSGFIDAMFEQEGVDRAVVVERDGGTATLSAAFARPALVDQVVTGSPADLACILPGDVIVSVDGESVATFSDISQRVEAGGGAPLTIGYRRDGVLGEAVLTPQVERVPSEQQGVMENRLLIGLRSTFDHGFGPEIGAMSLSGALSSAVALPGVIIGGTLNEIGAIFSGESDGSSISGPVGIASAAGAAADSGVLEFLYFVAILSTAIGFVNLFPIPILDGGHLVFYAAEAVRGRPLGEKWIGPLFAFGAFLLLMLMSFAIWNDVAPIWQSSLAECP